MLSELKEDDRVVTIGGVYGKIVKKGNGDLTLEIANNVRVKVLKSSISQKVQWPENRWQKTENRLKVVKI